MTLDRQIVALINMAIALGCQIDYDNDGQILIYTGHVWADDLSDEVKLLED